MKAALFYQKGEPLRIEEIPIPKISDGEALVKVKAASICHTELHFTHDGLLQPAKTPIVLGHEIAGLVEKISDTDSEHKVGDRVVVYYYGPCHRCYYCLHNMANLCPRLKAQLGFISDGGYAEYVKVPATSLVKLPENIPFESGATLGCSGTTALHAAREIANLKMGEAMVVYGLGGIGFIMIQLGKLMGANVIGIGRSPKKLGLAKSLGADFVIDANNQNVTVEVKSHTHGEGADVVFDLVGTSETMLNSVKMLRKRGRLVFVGYSEDNLNVHPIPLIIGELTIAASVGNNLQELIDIVALASDNKIKTTVAETYSLDEINQALEKIRLSKIPGKAVIVFD